MQTFIGNQSILFLYHIIFSFYFFIICYHLRECSCAAAKFQTTANVKEKESKLRNFNIIPQTWSWKEIVIYKLHPKKKRIIGSHINWKYSHYGSNKKMVINIVTLVSWYPLHELFTVESHSLCELDHSLAKRGFQNEN